MVAIGTTAMTQYLCDLIKLDKPPDDAIVWGNFNSQINQQIVAGAACPVSVTSGALVRFGTTDFHRGVPVHTDGWRWFARATVDSTIKATNKIRRQVQVYLTEPEKGW